VSIQSLRFVCCFVPGFDHEMGMKYSCHIYTASSLCKTATDDRSGTWALP